MLVEMLMRPVVVVVCWVTAVASSGAETSVPPRPNVLLVLTDDQGWGDVRSHGNLLIDTPVLDRLAGEGARFDRFFVCPYCSPTRASLLTGRYPLRTGVHGVTRGYEDMRADEVTLAEMFKAAGYATGCFGKWHNGYHWPMDPNGQGFDEFLGFCGGHTIVYFDPYLQHNDRPARGKGYITDVLTDAAIRFMRDRARQPFFCYVPYNAPHTPTQVPDRYFDKYKSRGLDDYLAAIYGMCECVDDNVGRLLVALDELKLAKRTIVLFLSDNGPNGERYNGGMRGIKGSLHEGGMRVPLFVRFPGRIRPGTTVGPIAAQIDLLPTLAELCAVKPPQGVKIDGTSLVPLLEGRSAGWPERRLFAHYGSEQVVPANGTVRSPRWRLVFARDRWELYDMLADPSEKKDVAKQHPDVVAQLSTAYQEWYADVARGRFDPMPIPVGHRQRPEVVLNGHEAFLQPAAGDGISYVSPKGWAQEWITNWTKTSSWSWWPIEVVQPGRYEVALLYTCPATSVGTRLRVEVGSASVAGTVSEAFDPPAVAGPNRSPIGSALRKDWRPLVLGTVDLPKGQVQLTVRALDKPGPAIIDLKGVRLRMLEKSGVAVEEGRLMRDGRPYRAFGVNYPDLFSRTLLDHNDTSYRAGLKQLAQAGIPWARFKACGFWPIDNDLYFRDEAAYFALMDQVVRAAEEYHVGLVPSLFWHFPTVPDMMGEPIDQLGNRQSKTIAFIRQYTAEVVSRYKDSPAVWGWELGNEYNLGVDLPNAAKSRPWVAPRLKTPSSRSARDDLTSAEMLVVIDEFARTVRRHDPRGMIISGNSVPRASAYHNTLDRSWKPDTPEQFVQVLLRDNPHPLDTLCVHIYPVERGSYPAGAKGLNELIAAICRISQEAKKPLFVGEFGAAIPSDPARERAVFQELLDTLERHPVPLAALWAFDFKPQDKEGLNVTFDNARAYQLQLIGQANARLFTFRNEKDR